MTLARPCGIITLAHSANSTRSSLTSAARHLSGWARIEMITNTALPRLTCDRHCRGPWLLHGRPDRSHIGDILVVAGHKPLDIAARVQRQVTREPLQVGCAMLRNARSLQPNQARSSVGEVLEKLRTLELHTYHLTAVRSVL
jgi:hypothetical protein